MVVVWCSFLRVYSSGEESCISLDVSAKKLGVERRRIYDIVNILEAVAVVSRRGKNQYDWHGMTQVAERIRRLGDSLAASEAETGGALKTGMLEMNASMMRADTTAELLAQETAASVSDPTGWTSDAVISNLVQHNVAVFDTVIPTPNTTTATTTAAGPITGGSGDVSAPVSSLTGTELTGVSGGGVVGFGVVSVGAGAVKKKKPSAPTSRDVRREQSLGHLSAVFVQMFLANEARMVSLEDAAKWLLKGSVPPLEGEGREGAEEGKEGKEGKETLRAEEAQSEVKDSSSASLSDVTVSVTSSSSPLSSSASLPPTDAHRRAPVSSPSKGKASHTRAASLFKSKVRRLYDIANVFSSLKLIDKVHLIQSRRPAFRWLGAELYPLESILPPESYTREGTGRGDLPAKRRSSFKQDMGEDAKRVKKEGLDDLSASGFPHTLHSSFAGSGGALAGPAPTRPLAFSFSPSPSTTQSPSTTATAPAASSTSAAGGGGGAGGAGSGGGGEDERFWFLNPPHSFCIEKGQMATFSPIDFAYLPYMRPDNLPTSPAQGSSPTSPSAPPSTDGSNAVPPHVLPSSLLPSAPPTSRTRPPSLRATQPRVVSGCSACPTTSEHRRRPPSPFNRHHRPPNTRRRFPSKCSRRSRCRGVTPSAPQSTSSHTSDGAATGETANGGGKGMKRAKGAVKR